MSDSKPRNQIQFRLPLLEEEALAKAAAENGMKTGDYAKRLVREGLARETDLATLRQDVATLNRNLANATLILLVKAGKFTTQEANDWLRTVFVTKKSER